MNITKNHIMKKLPIGISKFAEIRASDKDYIYVDKTPHVVALAENGKYYFLSRPRRFGKSLLIDTIKQAFLGNKELFSGLYLEQHWNWGNCYPVLHFDFGDGVVQSRSELEIKIHQFLDGYYWQYQVESIYPDVSGRFSYLIKQIALKYGKLVILIDEYDKPILDNINNVNVASEISDGLKNFYSVIKSHDEHLQFAFLTGVSKFSKVSLFSGLNILEDLTIDAKVADICGYTQEELESAFGEHLRDGNVDKVKLKTWYNGYNFAGSDRQKVYNPFDILLFFNKKCEYRNYWFETATPTFLIKLIEERHAYVPNFENLVVSEDLLSSFEIETIPLVTLLFQTGYLTIKNKVMRGSRVSYMLGYPNLEVKFSLNECLAEIGVDREKRSAKQEQIYTALTNNKFEDLALILSTHFSSIPHAWYRKNNIAEYEGFYSSIVYSYLASLGYQLTPEDVTNQGQIDLTLIMEDKIIILEFKLAKYGSAAEAIEQIKTRNYAAKYLASGKPIYLLGISFDETIRNIAEIISEEFHP